MIGFFAWVIAAAFDFGRWSSTPTLSNGAAAINV